MQITGSSTVLDVARELAMLGHPVLTFSSLHLNQYACTLHDPSHGILAYGFGGTEADAIDHALVDFRAKLGAQLLRDVARGHAANPDVHRP